MKRPAIVDPSLDEPVTAAQFDDGVTAGVRNHPAGWQHRTHGQGEGHQRKDKGSTGPRSRHGRVLTPPDCRHK